MNKFILRRCIENKYGTFGLLINDNMIIATTAERPYIDNQRDISCIPDGVYRARWTLSAKRGIWLYELRDVPDRENIQIHAGNYPLKDSTGCILLGMGYETFPEPMITNSTLSTKSFNAIGAENEIEIEILKIPN